MLLRTSLRVLGYFSSVKAYNPAKNYYKVLNLTDTATQQDIKRSFRELAKKYHPDSNKGKEEAFKEVNEAYQVLSDEAIKRSYDEERKLQEAPRYDSRTGPNTQSYTQSSSQRREQSRPGQSGNNYRGYQREEGWQNRSFREQFMYDLHRAQQGDYSRRNFSSSEREQYEREFRESMQRATQSANETIRQYSEEVKRRQAERRRNYEEEERRREEEERRKEEADREFFREFRASTHQDANQKLKEKLNKFAQDIAGNIKQVLSVTDELKNIWQNIKKKK